LRKKKGELLSSIEEERGFLSSIEEEEGGLLQWRVIGAQSSEGHTFCIR